MNDLDPLFGPASTRLVGRDGDLAFIHSFFNNPEVHGAALLLSGEAGVGKTAVLDAVAADAVNNDVRVLRAAGVQFEADISYAGLNQLLVPLLRVAIGTGGGPAPGRLLTSTAVLMLLRLISARTPAPARRRRPAVAGPGHQRPAGFVARRLVGSRIGFLAASRTDSESFFESSGLTERRL
ncbi:AAA family ATPase [Streptomyces canus]|uniref:AAA family ATPase n=1 Tax=Streptomyces canus TaxID=58343 RepID=UPI0033F46EA1